MITAVLSALWFFLPAGVANVTPIIVAKIPILVSFRTPLDLGKTYRGQRILGDHKTWRGLVLGVVAAIMVVYLQQWLFTISVPIRAVSLLPYSSLHPVMLGFLFGFGALFGDAFASFFKRQNGIQSGERWIPFDQIDYVLGGIIFSSWIAPLEWQWYIIVIVVWVLIHPLASIIGYFTGFKAVPW